MASAKLTLVGMYNYDDTLFDGLDLPEEIDKDEFVASLLIEAGEFEVLYPDLNFFKGAIALWSLKWKRTFTEWIKGTQAEWNPIENYDRIEDTIDLLETTKNLQDKRTADLSNKTTFNSNDTNEQVTVGENEHLVSAYDASGYSPKDKDTVNLGKTKLSRGGNDDLKTTGTDTYDHTGTSKDKRTIKGRVHGNIGVTQSSDMLRSFYEIAAWNLINHMIDVFKSELLICVY